jgi:hypothetical protein
MLNEQGHERRKNAKNDDPVSVLNLATCLKNAFIHRKT